MRNKVREFLFWLLNPVVNVGFELTVSFVVVASLHCMYRS